MLTHKPWREQVLKELGGLRKLKLWEAAKLRIETRAAATPKAVKDERPAWHLTPERIAESERLKARARMCGRAAAHPLVFRDRCKMDFDGLFRLAPLPREERAKGQMKVYTKNSIVDYDWNNTPFAKEEGFGPAPVWPVEFYAAMALETQSERNYGNYNHLNGTITTERRSRKTSDSQEEQGDSWLPDQVWDERNLDIIPTIPLDQVLSPKVRRDLFGSLTP